MLRPIRHSATLTLLLLSVARTCHGLTLAERRSRLSQAFSSPAAKLTLSPELVIPNPTDMTAILLQTNAIQTMSAQLRAGKANAVFLQGSDLALQTFCTEQGSVLGRFPGPLPTVYCSMAEDMRQVAESGADGLLVRLNNPVSSSNDVASLVRQDATFLATIQAALDAEICPIPEITIHQQDAAAWKIEDSECLVSALTELMGTEPVAVVLSVEAKADDDEASDLPPLVLPPVSKQLGNRVPILVSVRVSGGDGRLGAEMARLKDAGYSGAFLRNECVPRFRLNDLETIGRFWAACIKDLKSTKSKSFSFQSKNNMEKSLGTQWANLQNSVMESGALGDPNEQVSMMDNSSGDYSGF